MQKSHVAVLLCALTLCAADLAPETILLARLKAATREGLSQIPAYACTQVMDRFYRSRGARVRQLDRVELEVAQIGHKELYAKLGAKEFKDVPLTEVVKSGMTATGLYVLHAESVFLSDATVFVYKGEAKRNGRRCVRFDYRIAQIFSKYQISSAGYFANVGMEGSFWADPKTLQLIELEVRATDLPPLLRMKSATTRIIYNRANLNGHNYLIPASASVISVTDTGEESQIRTEFQSCRKYTGEATITF